MAPHLSSGQNTAPGLVVVCLCLSVPSNSVFNTPTVFPHPPLPPPMSSCGLYYLPKLNRQDLDQRSHTSILSTSANQEKSLS